MHILKLSEWQSGTGKWHCGDVEDLAHDSGRWWYPCRLLGISPVEYILLLKDKYHASNFSFRNDMLLFSWEKQQDMRKFKNDINKLAREKKFMV